MNKTFSLFKNNSFIADGSELPNNLFMSSFGTKLRARISDMEISEAEVARRLGISPRRFSNYVNDEREADYEMMLRICEALRVTPDYLFGFEDVAHIGNTPDLPSVPSLPATYVPVPFLEAKAGMGGGMLPPEAFGEPRYFESSVLASLRASADDLFTMEVEGQSMEAVLFSGDQILVHRKRINVSEPGIFVLWDGDGIVCKWVERDRTSDTPKLRVFSENPRFKEYSVLADEAVIHGRVIWFARRM